MKICIFTNHFFPENFKVNDITFELAKQGYEITVITAIPDYPQGKFYDGYSLFKRRREYINGVLIIRLPIIPRRKGTRLSLMLNYVSYLISSLIFTFFHWYSIKYDVVFVHLTSPFFICLPAALLKRKQRIPLVLWVLDLWPESLSAAGKIKNRFILYTQTILVRYVYDNSDTILIGSKGFESSICEKGNYKNKLIYFPNWAESVIPIKDDAWYQQLKPFTDFSKDDFIILFAGNIGEAQNLDCVIDTAAELKSNHAIKFVFIGDGRKRESLENKVNELYLSDCVFFLGQYPLESMPVFMQMADILLVSLKDELIFNLTVPSKVQFYMAQGKPILAMLNGDGADIINAARCGKAVPANDSKALQCAIQEFFGMPKQELQILGSNGKKYYEAYFGKEQRMEQLNDLFKSIGMI